MNSQRQVCCIILKVTVSSHDPVRPRHTSDTNTRVIGTGDHHSGACCQKAPQAPFGKQQSSMQDSILECSLFCLTIHAPNTHGPWTTSWVSSLQIQHWRYEYG